MINRHNYEEFFLMYVDNELTIEQCTEVELFVQQNSDLQQEFEMLLQTKLLADEEISFGHKTDLLNIKDSIGIDNYQEYFLLYIDNELNESSKEAVEKFVLQQPQLQNEFTLLKQTILPQEKIVFPNKKSLYRREERRVIPFAWMRVAAAAALVGAAALIWWMMPGAKHTPPIAVVQPDKQTVKPLQDTQKNKITQPSTSTQQNNQIAKAQKAQDKKEDKEVIAKTEKKNNKKRNEERKQNINTNDNNDNLALNNKKENNTNKSQPQATQEERNNNTSATTDPVIADVNSQKDNQAEDPLEKAKSTNAMHDVSNLIKPAVYKELDTDDEDRNAMYIGNMEINKNKVRGFMKKVGGLFAGKSKGSSNEKGKLQVANFELNTN